MVANGERAFEVVVWGATGFTGALVAEYLLDTYGARGDLRWAIAGRDQSRLEQVRARLGAGAADLPLLTADARDPASMDALASQSQVVCSTVGPYSQVGSELVRACVQQGTDCCDLSGEPHWIRQMIDAHHETARQAGVHIVNSCGFDSIPSDLGVHFLNAEAQACFGGPCSQVKLRVERMNGTLSGGTVASMFHVMGAARTDPSIAEVLRDPYGLNPEGERSGADRRDLMGCVLDADLNAWITPFIMASINTRIVRRSHALLGYPYGKDFRYDEAVLTGSGAGGRVKGVLTTLGLGAFAGAAALSPALIRPMLPKPGQGPSARQRERGSFSMLLLGKHQSGGEIKVRVTGDRDPGYGSTSKMLGESAVCLAKDIDAQVSGGMLTPASSMPEPLLRRLTSKAGLTFEVLDRRPSRLLH